MSATGKTWTTTRRLGYFWHLARIWFRHEHKSIKDEIGSKIDEAKTEVLSAIAESEDEPISSEYIRSLFQNNEQQ